MLANVYAFQRLRAFHARIYFDLGAPAQDKMHSLDGATRRKWRAFLKGKGYLTLHDPRLKRACLLSVWIGRITYGAMFVAVVLLAYAWQRG